MECCQASPSINSESDVHEVVIVACGFPVGQMVEQGVGHHPKPRYEGGGEDGLYRQVLMGQGG